MDFYHMDEESRIRLICKWVVDIVLVVSFAWFIVYAFGTSVTVSGNSMQPVLKNGDVVLMNRLAYDFGSPDRMDLVVFSRGGGENNIKRVIGLPGETVQIEGGVIYIDGAALEAEDGLGQVELAGLARDPVTLGNDEYFLLGDNRESSEDSRFSNVGNVKKEQIQGKAWVRISPVTAFGPIRARDTDLGRVERVNALSRRLCAGPLPPEKFRQAVEEVRNAPAYPDAAQCAMYAVISAAFSAFFGGTLRDAATAAVSGMLLFGALRFCQRLRLNGILQSMLASALAALAVMLMVGFGLGQNPDKIIIGNIMLLIPGIALTTSLRDMINGDTISGLLGLSEAVLKALAIAIGFAAVLMRMGG